MFFFKLVLDSTYTMSTKYKATTTEECYFITITTVGWIDVFTRLNQKQNIISALQYCQTNKGQ